MSPLPLPALAIWYRFLYILSNYQKGPSIWFYIARLNNTWVKCYWCHRHQDTKFAICYVGANNSVLPPHNIGRIKTEDSAVCHVILALPLSQLAPSTSTRSVGSCLRVKSLGLILNPWPLILMPVCLMHVYVILDPNIITTSAIDLDKERGILSDSQESRWKTTTCKTCAATFFTQIINIALREYQFTKRATP